MKGALKMDKTKPTSKPRVAVRIFSMILVAALLAGALPQFVLAAPPNTILQTCARTHVVESGDTLSSISVTYDISVAEIAAANNLVEPYTLVIGQNLCIPGSAPTTPSGSSTTSASDKPGFTIQRQGNNLVIVASNYPQRSNFYVKIKKGRLASSEPWVKLGILRTKKNDEVARSFRLPKSFYNSPQFQVCLKNAKSDGISCQSFYQ
jgi:hypothetical protein